MTAQILAAVIFVGMFALIIMDKFERQYVTLGSAALVLVVVFGICMHSWDAIKNALNLGASSAPTSGTAPRRAQAPASTGRPFSSSPV